MHIPSGSWNVPFPFLWVWYGARQSCLVMLRYGNRVGEICLCSHPYWSAYLKMLFPCLYSALSGLCSQLLTLDEPLLAGGRTQELSQVSSVTLVEMNEQTDPPSLRTGWRQWWIQSPGLLTSSITAKLIINLGKMLFSLLEDKAPLLSSRQDWCFSCFADANWSYPFPTGKPIPGIPGKPSLISPVQSYPLLKGCEEGSDGGDLAGLWAMGRHWPHSVWGLNSEQEEWSNTACLCKVVSEDMCFMLF